jgi:hypothetical protein
MLAWMSVRVRLVVDSSGRRLKVASNAAVLESVHDASRIVNLHPDIREIRG